MRLASNQTFERARKRMQAYVVFFWNRLSVRCSIGGLQCVESCSLGASGTKAGSAMSVTRISCARGLCRLYEVYGSSKYVRVHVSLYKLGCFLFMRMGKGRLFLAYLIVCTVGAVCIYMRACVLGGLSHQYCGNYGSPAVNAS